MNGLRTATFGRFVCGVATVQLIGRITSLHKLYDSTRGPPETTNETKSLWENSGVTPRPSYVSRIPAPSCCAPTGQRITRTNYFWAQRCLWKVLWVQRDDEVDISVLGTITNVNVVRVRRQIASRADPNKITLARSVLTFPTAFSEMLLACQASRHPNHSRPGWQPEAWLRHFSTSSV